MPKTKNKGRPNVKTTHRLCQTTQRIVPYVSGFRPPTFQERKAATSNKVNELGFLSQPHENDSWQPIPKCSSVDDWLAQYAEQGQTLNHFIGKHNIISIHC